MTKGSREVDGAWLSEELNRLGLSIIDVAKELGCDPKKIYNHTNNKTSLQAGMLASIWVSFPKLDMRYVLTGERQLIEHVVGADSQEEALKLIAETFRDVYFKLQPYLGSLPDNESPILPFPKSE